MARSVKCPICQTSFFREQEEYIEHSGRYYHKLCFEKKKEQELELQELEIYIQNLFNITYVPARIKKQIKQFVEEYKCSYSGIKKTLIYFFEIKKNSIEKSNGGIGIVPYVYQEAAQYYYNLERAQKQNEALNIDNLQINRRVVTINSPKLKPKHKKLFSIEEE